MDGVEGGVRAPVSLHGRSASSGGRPASGKEGASQSSVPQIDAKNGAVFLKPASSSSGSPSPPVRRLSSSEAEEVEEVGAPLSMVVAVRKLASSLDSGPVSSSSECLSGLVEIREQCEALAGVRDKLMRAGKLRERTPVLPYREPHREPH